jgi:hypothetical protein
MQAQVGSSLSASSASPDYNTFQREFYTYYVHFIETQLKNNQKYAQDKFWLYAKDITINHNIRKFDSTTVKYLTNTIRSKMGLTPIVSSSHSSNLPQQLHTSSNSTNTIHKNPMKHHIKGRQESLRQSFF